MLQPLDSTKYCLRQIKSQISLRVCALVQFPLAYSFLITLHGVPSRAANFLHLCIVDPEIDAIIHCMLLFIFLLHSDVECGLLQCRSGTFLLTNLPVVPATFTISGEPCRYIPITLVEFGVVCKS